MKPRPHVRLFGRLKINAKVLNNVLHKSINAKYTNGDIFTGGGCIIHSSYSENFLGVPFNISSYALLMHMVAHACDLNVGNFVYTLGDYHIYKNHIEQVNELLTREPYPLPKLEVLDESKRLRGLEGLLDMRYENLKLVGYQSHGKISAAVAV